ncbi:CXXC motif containing zinc binding protein-like [Dermatophagoides pteronyssinus]|uniref:CXXC motif containing zinc binding protein-like n=1 Tax=Dermatophagoides pteronyssinus TaxID=6956 RepID=UPI003F666FE6
MRVSVLEISAQLENVTNLTISSQYEYHIKFKCNNCDTETENFMTFSDDSKVPLMGGKSFVNLIFKCKICSRPSNVSIIDGSIRSYLAEDSTNFKPLIEFDCRGCDPILFQPINRFKCTNMDNTTEFNDVDLSELNWADYDERTNESVGIYDFKYRFTAIKKSTK